MSYNKKAIAEALSKLNKARKPKQVNDIIMDPEGQNKFPGLPTRIPSNNITMETTPYPVLGIDNLGNQQMMYPGANYLFPGADYVDEYPMAKYGGLVTGLTNTKGNLLMSSKGKRMMAKSGSLYATNKLFLGNPLVTKRKKAVFVPGHDFQSGGTTNWKSRIASTLNYQKGGQKDKWGRSPDSKWYGFDPERKQYTLGNKAPKTPIKSQKNYFAEGLYQMANNQPSSETVDQSRGLSSKQQVEVKDRSAEAKNIKEQARQEYNRAAVEGVHPNMYADTRSDVQRQRDQEAASQLTDPTGWNKVKNMLQAPLFQAGNFWDYVSGGDDWKQAQQDYNLKQVNPYVSGSEKALNFASTAAGLTGEGLMTGMDIIDGYALAKAIPGSGKYIKNLFPTKTPKQLPGSPNASSVDDVGRGLGNSYDPTPRINRIPVDYSEKALLPKDMEPYIGRRIIKPTKDQEIFESFLSGDLLDKHRNSRIINYTQAEAQALDNAKQASFLNPLALADKIVPMLNPLGFVSDGMTPFFLSPLQQLSFYGKKLKGDNMAFRKFGNDLSHVQKTKTLDPSAGGWRMGKSKIINEGNWAAMRETNERYPGLFEATFDFNNPKTNLDYMVVPKRDGVLIVNKDRSLAPTIDLKDPGVSLNRRLPFSSRYVPINKEKLLNNQFQLATQLPYVQSLIEKYGIGAGWAAAAAIMGGDREILNNYLDLPKKGLDRFIENLKEQADKSGLNLQFQQGGTTNIPLPAFQDMELTDEEIEEYKRGGCTIVKL